VLIRDYAGTPTDLGNVFPQVVRDGARKLVSTVRTRGRRTRDIPEAAGICGPHAPAMHRVAFSMQFRGRSTRLSAGVLTARATAPSSALVTHFDSDDNQLGVLFLPGGEGKDA
jgi:hypothetical protein